MKVGQKYSFEMSNHPSPYFVVCKIDNDRGRNIISIYIGGLKFANPHSDTGFGYEITHAPVDENSLIESEPTLVAEGVDIPDYIEGYEVWREAFKAGEGGYFAISPAKIVEYILDVISE